MLLETLGKSRKLHEPSSNKPTPTAARRRHPLRPANGMDRFMVRSCEAGQPRRRADEGVATVWTAIAVTALVWLGAAACWLGAAVAARHRIEAAADLGALAAAAHAADGPAKACARAREVADHQGAEVTDCHWDKRDALVEVRATRTPVPGLPPPTAHARAGPVGLPS
jgi:secretion/DNA translocation related TadE-like protein